MSKKIHRFWAGPDLMPTQYREYGRMYQEMNPDWEVIEWHPGNLPELINQDVWDAIGKQPSSSIPMDPCRAIAVQRSDVVYYQLALQFGGVCLNVDIEPLRPLNELLDVVGNNAWATYEDGWYLVNCAFGGPANHPFWEAVNTELPKRYFELMKKPGNFMQHTTGPHLLTHVWRSRKWRKRDRLLDLPATTFNYVYPANISVGGDAAAWRDEAIAAGAFGLHHWGHRKDQENHEEDS